MDQKTLVLGVSGGIAVYKVPELISRLRKKGIAVEVILTKSAAEFVTPLTFREVSLNPVHLDMFHDSFQWNVEHIALAKKADLMAVIPATANIIGKIANGIADDLLTTSIMATRAPKLIAPAMNTGMYENPALQKNLATLREYGFTIVGPEAGQLLCGDTGSGRMSSLEELEIQILRLLSRHDLEGELVLVTAGGTREPLDPVRYIGNRSSGKMGHALAEAAFKRGAKVFLISTSEAAPHYQGMETYCVDTAEQMYEKALELAPRSSIVIKAAAPADYRPQTSFEQKIKKSSDGLSVQLVLNPDILAELGKRKFPGQILLGFAAETQNLRENALTKLTRKNLDIIVGNLVNIPGLGMGAVNNRITIYTKHETVELPEQPKTVLADQILDYLVSYRSKAGSHPSP
ncbi:phosphopantothenoylcysteine decarboxylase/phosphopantothenate--cysteine ligase [Hydrogenispora ethanolica]|uniref:Coenzyme A biosynthesis bifunctional protein CoaBC n=1 Tax=Hydrogenispora ethanolica TaxID=1082276 RepID=A0A4R1RBG2_HYDET|nr:bifunctional phosphopantothenoylcysteine decarboxylase/phosphopantothenate--cysteine ligase CoaBC [Hydrogenispora ethanolica]TCL62970.1 phosphopantothenoylcysteine decarboxylase/phosphopantothenate--cysteine ligase [Hydrogenispora ethanolica]